MNFLREIPDLFKALHTSMPGWERWFIPSGFTVGTALSFSNVATMIGTIIGALAAIATTILAVYRIKIAHIELKQKKLEAAGRKLTNPIKN
tara:strand:- start:13546 stop:13818 length:273 start_codon:yes stop_codon:yes gene_type:complete